MCIDVIFGIREGNSVLILSCSICAVRPGRLNQRVVCQPQLRGQLELCSCGPDGQNRDADEEHIAVQGNAESVVFDNSPATTAGRGPDRRELPQPVTRGPAVPVNQLDQSARAALRYAMALSQEATSFVRRIVLTL